MDGVASSATSVLIGYLAGVDEDHPRRLRRRHAAEPRAAGDRRTVRHAGHALPRAHRSGAWPRAGHRPDDHARTTSHTGHANGRRLHRRRCRARRIFQSTARRAPSRARDPRYRLRRADLAARSSLYSAQVAAHLGYPFAFASHFAPAMLMQALQIYRARFKPNGLPGALTKPYAMVAVNVVCAGHWTTRPLSSCSRRCNNASLVCKQANAVRCPNRFLSPK